MHSEQIISQEATLITSFPTSGEKYSLNACNRRLEFLTLFSYLLNFAGFSNLSNYILIWCHLTRCISECSTILINAICSFV